jgi:hypothetical protein
MFNDRLIIVLLLQDKLLPHFGATAQVSFSFFSYHLAISIFGIVDATREKKYIYLSDKLQAGAKSSDHTINYLYQYVLILTANCNP